MTWVAILDLSSISDAANVWSSRSSAAAVRSEDAVPRATVINWILLSCAVEHCVGKLEAGDRVITTAGGHDNLVHFIRQNAA